MKREESHHQPESDAFFMQKALKLAHTAFKRGEVPVGAVIAHKQRILASAFNKREKTQDPLAHAELETLRLASLKLQSWRLNDCTLYVTLEPCLMCCGAILEARLSRLVYGCRDFKKGSLSRFQTPTGKLQITEGVKANESGLLLKQFFQNLRDKNLKAPSE